MKLTDGVLRLLFAIVAKQLVPARNCPRVRLHVDGHRRGHELIPSWLVSTRDAGAAYEFIQDEASRMRGRVQLTTDGHKPYLSAVEDAFGADIDYATLTKLYGADPNAERRTARLSALAASPRRSPAHRTRSTSARPTWSVRTSRCACRCAGSRA